MKRQFTSILLFSALLLGGASTFVSCKDYESDVNYETNAKMDQAFKNYADELKKTNDALALIKSCTCTNEDLQNAIQARIDANNNVIKSWGYITSDALTDYAKKEDLGADKLMEVLKQDASFKEALNASSAYKEIINNLYKDNGISDSLKYAYDNANKLLDEVYGKGDVPGLTNKVSDLQAKLEEVKALAKDDSVRIDELAEEVQDYVDASIDEVIDMIPDDEYINNLTDIKLQGYYTKTQLDEQLSDIYDQIYSLQESIWDILENQVSGIEIQASESPLTGYENTPFGVQVGFLGAYYGNGSFTDYAGNKVAGNVVLDDASNAGTIYVTVNPANVNPQAITLRLVDSQGNIIASSASTDKADQDAPFALEWANTDRVLKFGVSKAVEQKSNGFYAVNVRLKNTSEAIAAAKTWTSADKDNLKAAAKNILDKLRHPKSSNLQLGQIASTLNSVLNNRLTAYGVEASWQQLGPDGEMMDKKVTSKLSLAATAISPLSFEFLKEGINVDLPTIPTLQSKINFNDYKFNWTPIEGMGTMKTSITLKGMPDLDNIQINGSVVVPVPGVGVKFDGQTVEGVLDPATGKVTVDLSTLDPTVEVTFGEGEDKVIINKNNFKITVPTKAEGQDYDVEIPMTEFNKIIDNINSQVGNMIGNVNNIVGQLQGYAETIDGKYIAGINNYIKKFENLLTKSNSLLQPAMFYVAQNGNWGQLPKVEEAAAYLKLNGGVAQTVLVASSYTAEMLAPAYQKQITVDGGAQITGTDANGVLKGNKYKVGFKATKPGTYKITYKAVDYFGNKETKYFYIKVVE